MAPSMGLKKCLTLDEKPSGDYCDCPVCNLFGSIILGEDSEDATASKIWVYDAIMSNGKNPMASDGTGIDRDTGASARAARAKYDLEVIPRGSIFKFRIELQEDIFEESEYLLAAVLSEWGNGRCYLGLCRD